MDKSNLKVLLSNGCCNVVKCGDATVVRVSPSECNSANKLNKYIDI